MSTLLREEIKYIRDRAKAKYNKGTICEVCGTSEQLDFHHYYTMTPLWNKWKKERSLVIRTVDDILAVRDEFISDQHDKVYNETVTLCRTHHALLHSVYGKDPSLATAEKQKNWVRIQREKHEARILAT